MSSLYICYRFFLRHYRQMIILGLLTILRCKAITENSTEQESTRKSFISSLMTGLNLGLLLSLLPIRLPSTTCH